MRIVFAGTPAAAVPALRALSALCDVALVVTRPDAPVGRRRTLTPSPVAVAADAAGVPVVRAARIGEVGLTAIRQAEADIGVVVAYGAILADAVLEAPRLGWLNLHFSLLPRWRGAAPVQRAIAAGEPVGVTVMQVVAELDAGPLLAQRQVDVGPDATGSEATDLLAENGAGLLTEVVAGLDSGGRLVATPQKGVPTYARKLTRADGRIDWNAGRRAVYDRIRAMTAEPGAWCMHGDRIVKILEAGPATALAALAPEKDGQVGRVVRDGGAVFVQVHDGFVPIRVVQPAGGRPMPATAWLAGCRDRTILS